jgi:hypothetical protein
MEVINPYQEIPQAQSASSFQSLPSFSLGATSSNNPFGLSTDDFPRYQHFPGLFDQGDDYNSFRTERFLQEDSIGNKGKLM